MLAQMAGGGGGGMECGCCFLTSLSIEFPCHPWTSMSNQGNNSIVSGEGPQVYLAELKVPRAEKKRKQGGRQAPFKNLP